MRYIDGKDRLRDPLRQWTSYLNGPCQLQVRPSLFLALSPKTTVSTSWGTFRLRMVTFHPTPDDILTCMNAFDDFL